MGIFPGPVLYLTPVRPLLAVHSTAGEMPINNFSEKKKETLLSLLDSRKLESFRFQVGGGEDANRDK